MEITTFKNENVKKDGSTPKGGAVITTGAIRRSAKGGGCGAGNCHCSDGHWVSVIMPRDAAGTVEGVTFRFKNESELNKFLEQVKDI